MFRKLILFAVVATVSLTGAVATATPPMPGRPSNPTAGSK